jgi:hypothetical protein
MTRLQKKVLLTETRIPDGPRLVDPAGSNGSTATVGVHAARSRERRLLRPSCIRCSAGDMMVFFLF